MSGTSMLMSSEGMGRAWTPRRRPQHIEPAYRAIVKSGRGALTSPPALKKAGPVLPHASASWCAERDAPRRIAALASLERCAARARGVRDAERAGARACTRAVRELA